MDNWIFTVEMDNFTVSRGLIDEIVMVCQASRQLANDMTGQVLSHFINGKTKESLDLKKILLSTLKKIPNSFNEKFISILEYHLKRGDIKVEMEQLHVDRGRTRNKIRCHS